MKNNYKAFLGMFLVTFFAPRLMLGMDDRNENNKRPLDPLIFIYNELTKCSKIGMSEKDWIEVEDLINDNNQDEIIDYYLEKIFNDNNLEYMALRAVIHDFQNVITAIEKYKIPVLNAILDIDIDDLKELIKEGAKINCLHLHLAMENECSQEIAELLLQQIKKEDLQNYTFNDNNFVQYALDRDGGIAEYLPLLIQYGCIVGYEEMQRLIKQEEVFEDYFDLLLGVLRDVNEKPNIHSKSLLWHCVVVAQNFDWVEKMLKKGAIIEQQDIIDNFSFNVENYTIKNDGEIESFYSEKSLIIGNELIQKICESNATCNFADLKLIFFNQAIRNKILFDYVVQENHDKKNISTMLLMGADPNSYCKVTWEGGLIEYMPIIHCAALIEKEDVVFQLLSYGAQSSTFLMGDDLPSYSDTIKNIAKFALFVKFLKIFPNLHAMKNPHDIVSFLDKNISKFGEKELAIRAGMNSLYNSNQNLFSRDFIKWDVGGIKDFSMIKKHEQLCDNYFITHPWIRYFIASKFHPTMPFYGFNKEERRIYEQWMLHNLKKYKEMRLLKQHDFFAPINMLQANNKIFDKCFADVIFEIQKNN